MKKISLIFGVVAFAIASSANAGWSPFYSITSNYFQPGTDDQSIIITLDNFSHDCGWETGAEIKENSIGSGFFKTASSVILSAIMADKKISILTLDSKKDSNYCSGSKAKILALRIEQ